MFRVSLPPSIAFARSSLPLSVICSALVMFAMTAPFRLVLLTVLMLSWLVAMIVV